jgi:hypothetical protein
MVSPLQELIRSVISRKLRNISHKEQVVALALFGGLEKADT